MSRISALISDVDGTLVTEDKVLTPRAEEAVRKLHAAGIAFAITSGRPPRGMEMLIAPLELKTPISQPGCDLWCRQSPDLSRLAI